MNFVKLVRQQLILQMLGYRNQSGYILRILSSNKFSDRIQGMKTLITLAACITFALSQLTAQTMDERFDTLCSNFLKGYFLANPVLATQTGIHDYDSLLNDVSLTANQLEVNRLHLFKEKLADLELGSLSKEKNIDCRILRENINGMLFGYEELKESEWNPLLYTGLIGDAMASLLYQDFAPLEQRVANAILRAKQVPRLLEQAKVNLVTAPRMHVETAIQQNNGNIAIFEKDLLRAGQGLAPAIQDSLTSTCKIVIEALQNFGAWLEKDLLPRATKDPRLGKSLYDKKLSFALYSSLSPEQILEKAEAEKVRVTGEMAQLAAPLYKEYFQEDPGEKDQRVVIRRVLDKIALDHPQKEAIMDTIKRTIPELEQFVAQKDLLTEDPTEQLVIRETPEYERGIAVASLESPGPLEKHLKSFFNVMPIPADWIPDQVESFLKEYNTWELRDLCMHEGIPGHFVQLYYANRYPSVVRSVFASGAMIEGWAVYAERMVVDAGYMNDDPRMKLINLKMYLRTVLNAIIDQKIHAYGMTEKEMMDLLTNEGFQEEREAAGKWRRANLTSAQLSMYFVGFQEIWDLREMYRNSMGVEYSLKKFNETFLSYGSPPVKYLKEILIPR